MPTVKYKCESSGAMKTKTFPYNAMGKAQATEFAKVMGGSMKNNPNMYSPKKGYQWESLRSGEMRSGSVQDLTVLSRELVVQVKIKRTLIDVCHQLKLNL